MKIGIVSYGYGWVPCESGPNRFYYIAKAFCDAGWEVDLVGPSFQHFEKKPRDREKIAEQNYPFKVRYIDNPPYNKNIDLRRIHSNAVAAKNVDKTLSGTDYDLIYCSIPANNVAAEVTAFAKRNNIPLIIDVEDIWPEAMEMVIKNKLMRRIIFPYFMKDAEKVYASCDAVIGTSEDYTERATKYNHRDIPMSTVYVGVDLSVFDAGVRKYTTAENIPESAGEIFESDKANDDKITDEKNTDKICKPSGELWVSYAGSLGQSYDIETLIRAAKKLEDFENKNDWDKKNNNIYENSTDGDDAHGKPNNIYSKVRFKLLGTGPNMESLQALTKELGATNVEFLGYTAYPKMAAYLNQSDIVVNSFIKGAPQSIPNKIGDYLASGSAIISTLENPVAKALLDNNDCGLNVEPGNVDALFDVIKCLIDDEDRRDRQGRNARALAESRFDRAVSYQEIVRMADRLAK